MRFCGVLLLGLLCGCSLLIDVDRLQCESDLDCASVGFGARCSSGVCVATDPAPNDADAGMMMGRDAGPSPQSLCGAIERCAPSELCLDDTCWPKAEASAWVCDSPPEPNTSGVVSYRVQVLDFVTQLPGKDLTARACRINDIGCDNPLASVEDLTGSGRLELELPIGFMGTIEIDGDEMLTALYTFTRPLLKDTVAKDLLVVSPGALLALSGAAGFDIEDGRGLVILEAFDCSGVGAGGIHFSEDMQSAVAFYIVNELPNVKVTATVRDEDNDIAIGGFFNAKPGFTTFSAQLEDAEGPVVSQFNAEVRADSVTYLDLHP